MTVPSREEALAHFGVKGMKWGVRKPSIRGALLDQNQRSAAVFKRFREGRPQGVQEHVGLALSRATHLGKKRLNKKLDKNLGKLAIQQKRLESGKLKVRDLAQFMLTTPMADLVVSRRDTKG